MAVPLYLAESAPRKIRGAIVAINYSFVALGTAIAYITCYYIGHHWRYVCILPIIPAFIQLIGLLKIPRSPRWVYMNSAVRDIKQDLKQVYSSQGQLELEAEYESIKAEVMAVEPNFSLKDKFSYLCKDYLRGTLAALLMILFHQFSNFNIAMYYAPEILKESGF